MIPHSFSVSNCLPPVQRPRSCLLATWGLAIPPAIQLPHKQSHSVWLAVGTPRWTGGLLRRLPRLTLAVALIELDRSWLHCCELRKRKHHEEDAKAARYLCVYEYTENIECDQKSVLF